MSPIYPKLKEAGAVFEQVMGYERPTWFDPELASGLSIMLMYNFINNIYLIYKFVLFITFFKHI